jgi:hypothetical protein
MGCHRRWACLEFYAALGRELRDGQPQPGEQGGMQKVNEANLKTATAKADAEAAVENDW